jgi:hypothetical protein
MTEVNNYSASFIYESIIKTYLNISLTYKTESSYTSHSNILLQNSNTIKKTEA